MRRFNSYGPIDTEIHYYAPRKKLIEFAYTQLMGENPNRGGHYITVWAPRQCGKTWVMQEVLFLLKKEPQFDVLKINLESLKNETNIGAIIEAIGEEIGLGLNKTFTGINTQRKFQKIFNRDTLDKPLILILDEFDALSEKGLNTIVSTFRNIHISRMDEKDKTTEQKTYLLHAVALIGVRSVLGIENQTGSPFNIQRSVHIPNLTYDEVKGMFQWYEEESGQKVEEKIIQRLYDETRGQPGLTCWFGELLTEGYEEYTNDRTRSIGIPEFETVYSAAIDVLPNNNILNIISKANDKDYKKTALELFKTDQPMKFRYDNKQINFLYMNGVIAPDLREGKHYVKFSCPFVQKRLFNFFSDDLFPGMGTLVSPEDDLADAINDEELNIVNILKRYQDYLVQNHDWLFKEAPRRNDLQVFEAVFHFNLYMYLNQFLDPFDGRVFPEFPTGNGKIDLVIYYKKKVYALELKSFRDIRNFREALPRTAYYGQQLGLAEITLVLFVEAFAEKKLEELQVDFFDSSIGVTVKPVIIRTGMKRVP
ncbi:MAG: AAA-like domain-containing protein [Acidobacteria bacterium]|nr:AAA-like domain-containing protein [Acidobacteriota bacterium]